MRKIFTVYMSIVLVCIVYIGCNDMGTDAKPDTTKLALDYPKGGETFSFGDTITVSFIANGNSISSAGIQISSDSGENYFHISAKSVPVSGSGANKYSQKWIIGKESEFDIKLLYQDLDFASGTDPAWRCKIKIYDYDNKTNNVVTESFTVKFTKPYYLRYPIGGEIYKLTDSIPIVYTRRSDKSSIIERYFWCQKINDWWQILTKHDVQVRSKLTTEIKYLLPADTTFIDNPVGDSTKILINDYNIKVPLQSGWIEITK